MRSFNALRQSLTPRRLLAAAIVSLLTWIGCELHALRRSVDDVDSSIMFSNNETIRALHEIRDSIDEGARKIAIATLRR